MAAERVAELRGATVAKVTQLAMEYDPKPPFAAGTLVAAGPELTALATGMMKDMLDRGVVVARASRHERARPGSSPSSASEKTPASAAASPDRAPW